MIAPVTPKQEKILQLAVELADTDPRVWRRLLVPASYSLGELHEVIQAVMPWTDAHCHLFRVGKRRFGEPDDETPSVKDEESVTLSDIFRGACRQVVYLYDFGDSWQHMVTLEKRRRPDPETEYPVCLAGENASPPDDSGGPMGYSAKLAILRDPSHPEYERILEWMGEDFDPCRFDVAQANDALRYDPSTPEADEQPEDGIEPVSSADAEGLCAWCRRRLPADRPPITLDLAVCQRILLEGLEGRYILMPMPDDDVPIMVLVPEADGNGRTVVAFLCCEPCADALRHAWSQGEPSEPAP